MEWYYANERKQQGPVDQEEFGELVRTGVIHDETLVWRDGMENWTPYGEYKRAALKKALAEVKQVGLQELDVSSPTTVKTKDGIVVTAVPLASIGSRVLAKLVDAGVTILVMGLAMSISGFSVDDLSDETVRDKLFIGARIFELIYSGYFLGKYGATPGKMALGLEVVFENGARMTYMRGVQRQAAEWFSALSLGIGYLIALFDPGKRTLQDWICRTLVVRRKK